jgi:hypothetical protein
VCLALPEKVGKRAVQLGHRFGIHRMKAERELVELLLRRRDGL